jgi:hypothetical protein
MCSKFYFQGAPLDTCYLEPLSSCTLADVAESNDWTVLTSTNSSWDLIFPNNHFEELLSVSGILPDKHYFWWRAQVRTDSLTDGLPEGHAHG